jgi:hypothetical protein
VEGGSQKRDPEREFEEAFAAQSRLSADDSAAMEVAASEVEVPVMERAPLPPVAFLDDHVVEIPIHAEIDRPADPVPYLAQLTPFGTPQIDAEMQKAALRAELSAERPPVRRLPRDAAASAPARPSVWQRGAAITARTVANARAIAASTVESFREHALEYNKKAQIRSAEQRAAHEARLLDLEQRRAEAQQRAAELEAAREAAAARLVELVRQRDPGLPEEKQREEMVRDAVLREEVRRDESLRAEKREAAPVPRPPATRSWRLIPMGASASKPRRPMSPQLRTVLTGAAAVSALFIVGIALGSFYPRTPLAKPAAQSSNSANAPSGGVTVQTGGVTVKAGSQPAQKPSEPKSLHPESTRRGASPRAQAKRRWATTWSSAITSVRCRRKNPSRAGSRPS